MHVPFEAGNDNCCNQPGFLNNIWDNQMAQKRALQEWNVKQAEEALRLKPPQMTWVGGNDLYYPTTTAGGRQYGGSYGGSDLSTLGELTLTSPTTSTIDLDKLYGSYLCVV